jgi:hypothetical protein
MKQHRLKKNQSLRVSRARHNAKRKKAAPKARKSRRGGARLGAGRLPGSENKVTKEGRELVHEIVDFKALVERYYGFAMRGKLGPTRAHIFDTLMAYGFGKPPKSLSISTPPAPVNVYFHDVE